MTQTSFQIQNVKVERANFYSILKNPKANKSLLQPRNEHKIISHITKKFVEPIENSVFFPNPNNSESLIQILHNFKLQKGVKIIENGFLRKLNHRANRRSEQPSKFMSRKQYLQMTQINNPKVSQLFTRSFKGNTSLDSSKFQQDSTQYPLQKK